MVMANQQDQEGIKLFGKTITLHARQSKENQDHHHHHHHHHQHQIITTSTKENNSNPSSVDKRPDKIIPCPRCKSMETKFCYFNNYNVNQPRHFCKGCQRYWTAGGALRNVPVGAGRRKNKPPGRAGAGACAGAGFQDGCLYDVRSGAPHQFDLDGMVLEGWQVAAPGGFQHVFPVKRRRSCSGAQS